MSIALVVIIAIGLAACAQSGSQVLPGNSVFAPGKPGKMTVAVKGLKEMGRGGDTELAHVNPAEKRMLKKMGGSGTINPKTGLKEFKFGGGGHGASNDSRENDRGGSQRDGDRASPLDRLDSFLGKALGAEDDRGSVEIKRRKSVIDVAPGDERGGQSQRDGALILNISAQPGGDGGELGGGKSGTPTKVGKDEERRGGRAATLLSASQGIRDKLGRSGRRVPGKSLG